MGFPGSVDRWVPCRRCDGIGTDRRGLPCQRCKGEAGIWIRFSMDGDGILMDVVSGAEIDSGG